MTDEKIDYSDLPPLDESFFDKATVARAHKKDSTTLLMKSPRNAERLIEAIEEIEAMIAKDNKGKTPPHE